MNRQREGGKCKKSDGSGYYIYDLNGVKIDYSREDEEEDIAERRQVWRTKTLKKLKKKN